MGPMGIYCCLFASVPNAESGTEPGEGHHRRHVAMPYTSV